MGGRLGGLKTAALIDGHIHQNRTLFHAFQHGAGDKFRRAGAGNEDSADNYICLFCFVIEGVKSGVACFGAALEEFVEFPKSPIGCDQGS